MHAMRFIAWDRWLMGAMALAWGLLSNGCGSSTSSLFAATDGGATTVDAGNGMDALPPTCATDGGCVKSLTCKNSLDCPSDLVCDNAKQLCVDCINDADCKSQERCVSQVCRGACTSDKDCTPFNQLCEMAAGYCVSCLSSAQCASDQHCSKGVCVAFVCAPGTSKCEGNTVVACSADGSMLLP